MAKKKKKKGNIFEGDLRQDGVIPEENQFLDEPEEHAELPEEVTTEMSVGEKNVNVYTEEGREELLDEGELAYWEEGFSAGTDEPEKAHCAYCGKVLDQSQSLVEREIDEQIYYFCSNDHASKGVKHAKKR